MNKRRLLKLADLLEADAKNRNGIKFDLHTIADNLEAFESGSQPTIDCKTTACAIGLACISGVFKKQGLTYYRDYRDSSWLRFGPKVGNHTGLDAAYEFFGLTEEEGDFLFIPSYYTGVIVGAIGEKKVAKRIRDFVAGKVTC